MSECYFHAGRDSVGACISCGKMICLECRTMLGGKIYCQQCADELFAAKKPAAAAKPVVRSKIGGAWWLLPIFLTWVGGLITWLVNKDRDPEGARYMLIWGIAFTFIWIAFFWFFNWVMRFL